MDQGPEGTHASGGERTYLFNGQVTRDIIAGLILAVCMWMANSIMDINNQLTEIVSTRWTYEQQNAHEKEHQIEHQQIKDRLSKLEYRHSNGGH